MMEKIKSALLALLVALSLVQSYFLVYSMPNLETRVPSGQDYVLTEPMGPPLEVKDLLFPEMIVVHRGDDRHTVFYPDNTPYYDLILSKLQGRLFRGLRQDYSNTVDWNRVRREDKGIELRFGRPVPFRLLQQVLKIDGEFLFTRDSIERIWIFVRSGTEDVRTFFFSSDGRNIYESVGADLTVGDVDSFVGFGEYWIPYQAMEGDWYLPAEPYDRVAQLTVKASRYTVEQMQRSLFFDPAVTRAIQERGNGNLIYTDGKRGLKITGGGRWMSYTDPAAPTEGEPDQADEIAGAVQFVNQHGGWNGKHRLAQEFSPDPAGGYGVRFQQYYEKVPIISDEEQNFGYIELVMRKGVVTSYERSLLILEQTAAAREARMLPGGDALRARIAEAYSLTAIRALFPAYRPEIGGDDSVALQPVWAVRLTDGTVRILEESQAEPEEAVSPEKAEEAAEQAEAASGEDPGPAEREE